MNKSKEKLRIAVLSSSSGSDLPAIFRMDAEQYDYAFLLTDKKKSGARVQAQQFEILDIFLDPKEKSRIEYDTEIQKLLDKNSIDLVVLVGWMRLLSPQFVKAYRGKIINVHPSLLPAFAGGMDTDVHQEVLDAGVAETGATVHFVTEKVDTGPIIMQRSCAVDPNETPASLKRKVQELEQEMLPEVIEQFRLGTISFASKNT